MEIFITWANANCPVAIHNDYDFLWIEIAWNLTTKWTIIKKK